MTRENQDLKEAVGRASFRGSPQKTGLIADLIRGLSVDKALFVLRYSPRRIATHVFKLLKSVVANAEHNYQMDIKQLFVKTVWVGKGLTMKRVMFRAKGRSNKINKPFSRITLIVSQQEIKEVNNGTKD